LLKFKFTQIFLMDQNGFSKMTELLVNAPNYQRMWPNFGFQEDY
jgi:hypothetical protein